MINQKKFYNINELCNSLLRELNQHLDVKASSDCRKNRIERNRIVNNWLNENYTRFFQSYIKDHPIKL